MKITHTNTSFDTQTLGEDLPHMIIQTRNGATIRVTERVDGSLQLSEGSHRVLRILPQVANSIIVEIMDPFLEAAAPMFQIPDKETLASLQPGIKLYSVSTRTIWTWHGGGEGLTPEGFIVTSETGSGFGATGEFWEICAPLLLAAHAE